MPSNLPAQGDYLTINEAAKVLKVSSKTLRRWDAKNLLHPVRTDGGHRRYALADLVELKHSKRKIKNLHKIALQQENQFNEHKVVTPVKDWLIPDPIVNKSRRLNLSKKSIFTFAGTSILFFAAFVAVRAQFGNIFKQNDFNKSLNAARSEVLADKISLQDVVFKINVPSSFNEAVAVNADASISGNLTVEGADNTISGTLTLTGNRLAASGDLTIAPTGGGVRIGTTGTPTIDLANGDLFVSNQVEVGGSLSLNGDSISDFTGTGLQLVNGSLTATVGTTIEGNEISEDTIEEVDLKVSNDPTSGQVLTYDSDTGAFTWADDATGDTSPWDQGTDLVTLKTTTDSVNIGGSTDIAKLGVEGDSDEIQLLVVGNSTQTSNLFAVQNSSNTNLFTVDNSGNATVSTGDVVIGAIGLNDAGTSNANSGATLIGVYDEFSNSSATTLQAVLKDFDSAMGAGSSKWTDSGTLTYLTSTTDDVAIGGSTLASPFSVDVSANAVRIGTGATANGVLSLYASDGDTGSLTYNTSDQFDFSGGDVRVEGQLITGSSPITLTTTTGYLDADALQLISGDGTGGTSSGSGLETDSDRLGLLQGCSDQEILKWDEASQVWACSNDAGSGGTAVVNVQNNDVSVGASVDTLDFSTDFTVTASPSNEANISIADDILNFSEFSDSLVLDASTSITAGSALNLTIGNNVTLTTSGTGSIVATDVVCTDCITLATETSGNYIATITGNSQIGVSGSGSENAGVSLSITANSIAETQLAAAITFSDGDFLDFSAINNSSTTEGIKLPQNTSCASGTAEGQICWDTDGDFLVMGTGAGVVNILSSSSSLFTAAGDSGSNQTISTGDTLTIAGGTNGIDTVGTATDIVTLNLDTTEIGTTSFGSGSAFTWTFDASGGTDTTLAFGNNSGTFTGNTFTVASSTTNADSIAIVPQNGTATNSFTGTVTSADLTAARTWTFPDDTGTVCLTTGNCAGTTNYWQLNTGNIAPGNAASVTDRLVLGGNTTTPFQFEVNGKQTGKALASFNETGDQNILTASASGTTVANLDRSGNLTIEGALADLSGATLSVNDSLDVNGTAGLTLSGSGADLIFANGERLTNDSNGQFNFGRNDAGTVTLTANDDDATAALTILPGGAAALTLGGSSTTSISLTTDSTGDGELTVPGSSISNSELVNSSITFAGDSGSSATSLGGTRTVAGGTNGVDTSESGGTLTINLDTTEIGTTSFGSGSAFTWTFDASGGTDTTLVFGNNIGTFNANTFTVTSPTSNADSISLVPQSSTATNSFTGTVTSADLTAARTWTFPDDTGTVCLTTGNCAGSGGGITGSGTSGQVTFFNGSGTITSEASGFAWDATNNKLGIGTDSPTSKLHLTGAVTGKALAIFDETGDQNIFTASASGTTVATIDRNGQLTVNRTTANADKIALIGNNTGSNTFTGSITTADLTADRTWTLPDATGTVCLTTGNCAGVGGVGTMSTWTIAGDSGSDAVTDTQTVTIAGGTNGIDTSESGRTVTLNLDTTEIGNTTFGSGSDFTWTFNGSGSTDPTIVFGSNSITTSGLTTLTRTLTADAATTQNVASVTFSSPADTTGTNVNQGLNITPTIGNATGGTNTANIVNIGAVSGDAQVTLNAINIGGLTGTGATETALNVGSNWDSALTVAGTSIINGSGVLQSAGLSGTYSNALTLSSTSNALTGTIGQATPLAGSFTTLSSTGVSTIGNNSTTVAIDSNDWDVSTLGAMTGISGISNDGAYTQSGSNANTLTGATSETAVNAAGGSANALTLSGTLGIFDGSDTFRGLYLNYTNADHTGSTNVFNGIDIAGITGDAQATETALNIGSGWDTALVTNNGNINAGSGAITAASIAPSGAAAFTVGGASTTAITLTTDGTGDSEVVLPTGSISSTEILDDTISTSDLAATLTFSDGDFIDLSSINTSSTTEGLKLPQNATACSSGTAEGQICWDSSTDTLYIGNGSTASAIGGGTSFTSFTAAGDSGGGQSITNGNTLSIVGGTNGIDTVDSATDTVTINLDTTEIGTTTFGSGSGIVWTFDASAGTDPTFTFGNDTVNITAGTTTATGALTVTGTTTLNGIANVGDGGDAIALSGTTVGITSNSGSNDITLTSADDILFTPADEITATFAADSQFVIDASTTANTTTGGVTDLNVNAGDAAVIASNIDLIQNNGAASGRDAIAQKINLTANDADGDVFGLQISSAASSAAAAGSYEALLTLTNAENTAGVVPDALLITTTSGTAGDITDAIDASASDITNAINVGANFILGDGIRQFSSSSTVWTFEDTSGNDLATITDNGSTGTITVDTLALTTLSCTGCVETTDILDNTVSATDLAATLTLSDGDLLDLSSINQSANTEGLKLPQNATACSSGTAEGQICWDSSTDTLYVGNGSTASAIGGGTSFTSFTAAGDSGGGQSITNGNTLTIAGGTNGIDTVDSATDTVTINLDTTEITNATFGSGSGFAWTFDAGATDPSLTFASAALTIGNATTLTATDTTTLNCTDCIDFDDMKDSMTVDAATDINLGANALTIDLDSTGDFSIRDVTTDIATFSDTGAISFTPTSGVGITNTMAGAGNYSVTTATGTQTFTSSVVSGTTTTSGFIFDATAITTGTGMYLTSDSITQGKLLNIATTGNTLTSGNLVDVSTTATSLTSGKLGSFDWSPGSATTATGDLFNINIGTNGSTSGNLFSVSDTGSALFSVSETAMTSNVPAAFNAAGDVSFAYDIQFTNQTASYIKSNAPLYVEVGESFESNDLTLRTYNAGTVIVESSGATTSTTGLLDINATAGNAAVIGANIDLVQNTGATAGTDAIAQKINLTADDADGDVFGLQISAAATTNAAAGSYETLLTLSNAENTAGVVPDALLITTSSGTAGDIVDAIDASAGDITNAINTGANFILGDGIRQFSSSSTVWTFEDTSGNDLFTITDAGSNGNIATTGDLTVTGNDITFGNAETISNGTDNVISLGGTADSVALRLPVKSTTGDSGLDTTEGNIYYNASDDKFRCYQGSAWTDCISAGGFTSFTAAGDSGGGQTISNSNTLTIAGGTNGIDTVDSATDTVTINLDTTEIGSVTFNAGASDPVWTVNTSGATDPTLTFANSSIQFGSAATLVSDQATLNLFNATSSTINAFSAATTLNVADAAITGTIDIGGVTSDGVSTVNIATNATSADVITIGNSHASTTVAITGGDDYSLAATGVFTLSASASQTTAIVATDTDYTNFASIGDNNLLGTTAAIDFTNFDVATTGNITTATGTGLDCNAGSCNLKLGVTNATTIDVGTTAATAINIGAGGSLTRAIAIGTGTGADTITIGTGGTGADTITIGNNASSTALNLTSGTGAQTFTSSVASTSTTSSAWVFSDAALNTGTGLYLTGSALTTGKLAQFAPTGNTQTTGTILDLSSTATSITTGSSIANGGTAIGSMLDVSLTGNSAFTGNLSTFDFSPTSATTATGDIIHINVGTNGNVGNLLNITDGGTSLFSVSETAITSALPHNFTAPGDVNMAYDLVLTNQTASFIKSNAPLTIDTGEVFESNNLTLRTYNSGNIIADLGSTAGKMSIGSNINPVGLLTVSNLNTTTMGKALAMFDQDESQAVITASASGTTIMTLTGGTTGDLILGADGVNTAANIGGNGILVYGAVCVDDSLDNADDCIDASRAAGSINSITFATSIDDLAENFPTQDSSLEGADIVSLDYNAVPEGGNPDDYETEFVKKSVSSDGTNVLGVISAKPGGLLGGWGQKLDPRSVKEVAVALSGRIPVKVTSQNGNIAPGDFITLSSIPGVGVKSTSSTDSIVGKALDKYENSDTNAVGSVLVFVNTQWERNTQTAGDTTDLNNRLTALENDFNLKVNSSLTATDSGILANFSDVKSNTLSVLGDTVLSNTVINGTLNIGAMTFDNVDQSINAVGTLKIQSLALGNIELQGGLVTIDTTGNVVVNTITAQKYQVAGSSAGTSTLFAGTTEISVTTPSVTANSLIFVTPKNATNSPIAVTTKVEGDHFIVSTLTPNINDVDFDWFIVDKQ